MTNHAVPQSCIPSTVGGAVAAQHLLGSVIRQTRPGIESQSPIDRAYDALKAITSVSYTLHSSWTHQHGSMLAAATVAAVEDYFRTIFVEIAMICPFAIERANRLETRVLFVETGSREQALRSTLELVSFSSADNIDDWCNKLVGQKASKDRSLSSLMTDFSSVFHLRHCITHAGGYVSVNNSNALRADPGTWVSVDSAQNIDQIVAIVTRLLRSFNQWLFAQVLGRWITDSRLAGDWQVDQTLFKPLWKAFSSNVDIRAGAASGQNVVPKNSYLAYLAIRGAVRSRQSA